MADSMPKLRVAQSPSEPPKRSNALAEILYGSTADSDVGASSGDELHEAQEDGEDIPVEDAASIIGVSISEAQARLTSPRTPAIEKAAALQESGGYFSEDWITPGNGGEDGTDGVLSGPPAGEESLTAKEKPERKEDLPLPHANPPSVQQRREGLPSPWQSGLRKRDSKPDTFRDSIGGAFLQHARKSSLGEVARKFNNLNLLPSFPKNFTFSVPNLIPSIPSFDGLSASKEDGSSKPSSFLEYFPRKPAARAEDPVSRPKVLQRRSTTTALPDRTQFGPESESSQSSSTDSDTFSPLPNKLDIMNVGPLPNRSRVLTSRRGQSQSSTRRRSASLDSLSRYLDHVRNVSPIPNVNHFRRNSSVSLGDDSRFEHTQEQINNRIRAIRDTLQDHVDIRLPSLPSLPSISSFGFSSIVGASSPEAASRSHAASVAGLRSSAFQNGHHRSISDSAATSKQKAKSKVDRHPSFTQALEQLHGDVVVLGGYRGSILRSRESPKGRLWAPFKVSMGVQNVNLGLDLNHKLEETEDERIFSPGMLTHIGVFDISRKLLKRLRESENARNGTLRIHEWGYDWRLSPDILSRKFLEFVGNNCDEQPFIIAHSLGGLITRHAVNQHPHLFAGVLYAGTPQAAVNILGPLRNGDAVGFNKNILTAQVNFSIRTSFVFLPLDGKCFIDKNTKEEYDVNFFDVAQWEQYRLSPCIKRPLPALNPRSTLSAKFSSFGKRSSTSAVKPDMGAQNDAMNPATAVTIPYEKALPYLDRTLKKTRIFKEELRHVFMHQEYDRYPPHAVLYGKDTPTVLGAKVDGRHGIECADAYDDLAFASGDGVVLAKMAQLPAGYVAARGGVVATDKGHVSLLSDLEAVGKCLNALITARREGVGAIFTPY